MQPNKYFYNINKIFFYHILPQKPEKQQNRLNINTPNSKTNLLIFRYLYLKFQNHDFYQIIEKFYKFSLIKPKNLEQWSKK
jgi:hypothetical protein